MQQRNQGRIVNKRGSTKLYVDFFYFGRRIEKSTNFPDTPDNRDTVREWLDNQMEKIQRGTFRFAEAFPRASAAEKQWFAQQEGWAFTPQPHQVLVGEYLEKWVEQVWANIKSHTKKEDYRSALDCWIKPYFKGITFHQMTSETVKAFVGTLKHWRGPKQGQPLSPKRISNILLPLRAIWEAACEEHRWTLPDPLRYVAPRDIAAAQIDDESVDVSSLPEVEWTGEELDTEEATEDEGTIDADRQPLRFHEFQAVYANLREWYKPIIETMLLTGTIASELAGVERGVHVQGDAIRIRQSIVRGKLRQRNKNRYRSRTIRVTKAIRRRLSEILLRSSGRFVFVRPSGKHLTAGALCKEWDKAVAKAGIRRRVVYSLRHTFAAWCLVAGLPPYRVAHLMGHATRQMVYERYGHYVEGLEADREAIIEFLGRDFVEGESKKAPDCETFAKAGGL